MAKLPTWESCSRKHAAKQALTALEQFIFDWCPVEPSDAREFYADLGKVVDERVSADARVYQEINDCDKCDLCEDHYA